MANTEHLKILKQGVEVWNRWREEEPEEQTSGHYSSHYATVRDAALTEIELKELYSNWYDTEEQGAEGAETGRSADELRSTTRRAADLRNADLRGSNLQGAHLGIADLRGADLQVADLRHADLRAARICKADLTRANLTQAELNSADLQGAILHRAHLRGAILGNLSFISVDLSKSDLRKAKLGESLFHKANLSGADLSGASLCNANLHDTSLHGANMRDTDLRKCNLHNVNLCNAALVGSDLSDAIVSGLILGAIDLTRTRGLKSIDHEGPSILGVDVLQKSSGKLPAEFLRGCGLSDWEIEAAKLHDPELKSEEVDAFLGEIERMRLKRRFQSCFISYNHTNRSFAQNLYVSLQARGIRCWLDEHDLKPGDRILDVVDNAIRLHDRILLCCSETSLNSWWVQDEIEKALERERREGRDIIIPLNLDGYLLAGWESGQATTIRSRLAADFTGWEHDNAKFEEQFERVVRALRTEEGARAKPPESKL